MLLPIRAVGLIGLTFRLLPLGDSITRGSGSTHMAGYRLPLWQQLTGASRDFIGTQRTGDMSDNQHEGYSGYKIDQITSRLGTTGTLKKRPNVVLIHAGTNDMHSTIADPATAHERLGRLIDAVVREAPDATVLVAKIVGSWRAGSQVKTDAYNAKIDGVVKVRRNMGYKVAVVDMGKLLVKADMVDDLHPNDGGYRKMAKAWYDALVVARSRGWISRPKTV